MPEFIIASIQDNNRYIRYDNNGKLTITNRIENAVKFPDSGKAWRVLQNQMPKKKRDGWKIIVSSSPQSALTKQAKDRVRAEIDTSAFGDEAFGWTKVSDDIINSFSAIITYKEKLNLLLAKIEAELCDCEHACEFYKYDVVHGYKIYKLIRERRIKRRFYKDELLRIDAILGMSYSEIVENGIENAFKNIDEQTYTPRYMTELFDGSFNK